MFDFDDEFIREVVARNKNSFNSLYLDTVDVFFRYLKSNYFISNDDANDVLSDFYMKLWKGIESYKVEKSFNSWIWTIFKNTIKDYFKKSKELHFSNISKSENMDLEDMIGKEDDTMNLLETEFEFEVIEKAIYNLDENSREIIFLKYIEEKSNSEIAIILDITEENVRQRASRGLRKLRNILGNGANSQTSQS